MSRIAVFIDGFNVYHALDFQRPAPAYPNVNPLRYRRYKWLDFVKLADSYVYNRQTDVLVGTYYFTALATWDAGKMTRHQNFIEALETQGATVIMGRFKDKQVKCKGHCQQRFWTREEKETDVKIALQLLRLAVEDQYDKAIIISGDTDLIPAIQTVKQLFPHKEVGVIIPIGNTSRDMVAAADFHHQMRESHLAAALLPNPFTCNSGRIVHCPVAWS